MQIAQVGRWEFEMPEGWTLRENESSNSYFAAPDGSKGLYVKAIELGEPMHTPGEAATYIQGVHLRAFKDATENVWEVVDQRLSAEQDLARSALDIYDKRANYRVLSLVVSSCDSAIQVTVHDYWCEAYLESKNAFASLETSIVRLPGAAQLCVQADRR